MALLYRSRQDGDQQGEDGPMIEADPKMRLKAADAAQIRDEEAVCRALLPLAAARVLELGCGKAEVTRKLAKACPAARFTALETDAAQAALNLEQGAAENLAFGFGAAEAIPAADGAFDVVMMLKSLHHVPAARLDDALREVHRVLAPGGSALFLEPVFDGEYNEILRIFHDEEEARSAAFRALCRAVEAGLFQLREECFFMRRVAFESFAHFEKNVIGVTHTKHRLTTDQFARVRERFMRSATGDGAEFLAPMRADVLVRR
jgi:ubiquinone/menaquinone biosynthesis C-methylase UbiE